jgi:ribosomal protein L16/L10AE
MKQYPKNIKFKKNQLVNSNFFLEAQKNAFPLRGNYALKSNQSGQLTFKQIEACRKSIRRNLKKKGNI